ncbi:MAG: hypothetical protein K2L01_01880 [Rikenellaceae bacterium]|nr:hypothetical protein [Rikenellaceae bacterium]
MPKTDLYEDELGWNLSDREEAGGYTDTKDVWDHLIALSSDDIVGFDLCFYYPETDRFYYLDNISRSLFILPTRPDWDGKYIFDRVDIQPQTVPDEYELMEFEHASEVWDKFRIGDKDMRYILEHSVLMLST